MKHKKKQKPYDLLKGAEKAVDKINHPFMVKTYKN